MLFAGFGEKYDPELAGKLAYVEWECVILRSKPTTNSKAIDELSYGTVVTLTGNTCEHIGGVAELAFLDSWVEVELHNGTTGWVVRTSLD